MASFWKVCKVATSVDHPDEVTITTCCALPILASCCTSSGAGVAVFDGVWVGDGVEGVAAGVGFCVDGVGVGVDELATFGVATFSLRGAELAGLAAPAGEVAAADVDAGWPLEAGGWVPAAEGWLLVQAASVKPSAAIEAAQAAGLVRSRLPIWPG